MDADPLKRPTTDEWFSIIKNWIDEDDNIRENTEFYKQYEEAEEFNQSITSKSKMVSSSSYTTHSQAIYTSRLLDYKNLPEPQNSKEINVQFYSKYSGNYFLKLHSYSIWFILY